jgi:hypothetical protein
VWWMGYMTPGPEAGPEELRASLGGKLKRNISLGVVEALICLESAYHYCRQAPLHLTGEALAATLRRSRQLYASLALLHDEQERERLTFLTGIEGYLTYPTVDYHHVIGGQVRVPPDKFLVAGTAEEPRVRFVIPPLHSAVLDSPTKRCPAHRLRSAQHPEMALNDVLWDLLIEIYRQSGRFA